MQVIVNIKPSGAWLCKAAISDARQQKRDVLLGQGPWHTRCYFQKAGWSLLFRHKEVPALSKQSQGREGRIPSGRCRGAVLPPAGLLHCEMFSLWLPLPPLHRIPTCPNGAVFLLCVRASWWNPWAWPCPSTSASLQPHNSQLLPSTLLAPVSSSAVITGEKSRECKTPQTETF